MNIQKKIEEIRQKPERVRFYWAWGLTLFFTLVIIVFWLLVVKNEVQIVKKSTQQKELINEFQKQKKSLQKTSQGVTKVLQKIN